MLLFVTGNFDKVNELANILNQSVHHINMSLDEIQGEPEEIAVHKCEQVYDILKKLNPNIIIEDTSLSFNALNGLPGPYIKCFYEKLGNDGLYKMLNGYSDHSAIARTIIAYSDNGEINTFIGELSGTIVSPRGTNGFGWDAIFQPDGYNQTLAEMSTETKNQISQRYIAISRLKQYLS